VGRYLIGWLTVSVILAGCGSTSEHQPKGAVQAGGPQEPGTERKAADKRRRGNSERRVFDKQTR